MSRTFTFAITAALLVAGLAYAGEDNDDKEKKDPKKGCVASAGFVQSDFFKNLKKNLGEKLGTDNGAKKMGAFSESSLDSRQVLDLMNGKNFTKKNIKKWFGAKDREVGKVEESLKKSVDQKDKSMFFGAAFFTMVKDFGIDPKGDFAKQSMGSMKGLSSESWKKLKAGNRSKKTMKECFGLKQGDEQKLMQQILNKASSSGLFNHPMGQSMGLGNLGKGGASGKGGAAVKAGAAGSGQGNFPKMGKGSAGFGKFTNGMAGGKPFNKKLPACPFFGSNMKGLLGGSGSSNSK